MEEIVCGCQNNVLRHVFDKFQVHLNLKEETASVPIIEEMLKEQLGFDIRVLDSKHLPIMAGETTTGKWR